MDTHNIDLMTLVGVSLKKTANTNGGEFHGPCPLCGGTDRFWVAPSAGRWYCRHCTPSGGDAIAFVMARDNVDFKTALATLNLQDEKDYKPTSKPTQAPRQALEDDPLFLEQLADIHQRAENKLWSSDRRGLDYLHGRGLEDDFIQQARLGYIPPEQPFYEVHGHKVYPGIVIPAIEGGITRAIQFRNITGKGRYVSLGRTGGRLFGADDIQPFKPVVAFEGAFDAIIARHLRLDLSSVATFGASNAISPRWERALMTAPFILLFGDNDQAGQAWMDKHQGPAYKQLHLKDTNHHKDLNEMWLKSVDGSRAIVARYLRAYQQTNDDMEAFCYVYYGSEAKNHG